MSTSSIRRALLIQKGKGLALEAMKGRVMEHPAEKDYPPEVMKASAEFHNIFKPTTTDTVTFRGEIVWYTPVTSRDGLDTDKGKIQSIKSGVALVLSSTGQRVAVPIQNLEEKWKTKLVKMGFKVPGMIAIKNTSSTRRKS